MGTRVLSLENHRSKRKRRERGGKEEGKRRERGGVGRKEGKRRGRQEGGVAHEKECGLMLGLPKDVGDNYRSR